MSFISSGGAAVGGALGGPFGAVLGGSGGGLPSPATMFSGLSNNFTPNSAYAPGTQATLQNFQPAIDTANQNYQGANSGFDSLAAALNSRMNGQTPSLSGQMLSNATGANVANQAALMAGQRGASNNVGLMSRQIANQGANIQQQAAGQGAANQLAENQANLGALSNVYGMKGQLANQNLGIQQQAQGQQNSNIVGNYSGINNIGVAEASQNAAMNQGLTAGAAGAVQKLGSMLMADGGDVDSGGTIPGFGQGAGNYGIPGFVSKNMLNFSSGGAPLKMPGGSDPTAGATSMSPMAGGPMDSLGGGGMQDMMGGITQGATAVGAKGGMAFHLPFKPRQDYRRGGNVQAHSPQQKATVPGNSYANDKIPAMVSEGEIVIPRDISMHPNAPQLAAQFVAQQIAKRGQR